MKKVFVFCLIGLTLVSGDAFATRRINHQAQRWWGYNGETGAGHGADFVLHGTLQKASSNGTWGDEGAIVGVIARKIVEHGGYFCPEQFQCANSNNSGHTWTTYYYPDGFSWDKCAWLCEAGYSGENCTRNNATAAFCDKSSYRMPNGKFSVKGLKTSGKNSGEHEWDIPFINNWYEKWGWYRNEIDVVLGAISFRDHGIVASPVHLKCAREASESWVAWAGKIGKSKLLCAAGYTANADGTDCVPEGCLLAELPMCENFDKALYSETRHSLMQSGDCIKYFCKADGTAFARAGDTACTSCPTDGSGGTDPNTGLCVICDQYKYFNSDTGQCETAQVYTKSDLQYGKGKTRGDAATNPGDQCWATLNPTVYQECVRSGGKKTVRQLEGTDPNASSDTTETTAAQ